MKIAKLHFYKVKPPSLPIVLTSHTCFSDLGLKVIAEKDMTDYPELYRDLLSCTEKVSLTANDHVYCFAAEWIGSCINNDFVVQLANQVTQNALKDGIWLKLTPEATAVLYEHAVDQLGRCCYSDTVFLHYCEEEAF